MVNLSRKGPKAWWAGHGAAGICMVKRTSSDLDLNPAVSQNTSNHLAV